ncbi:MAG: signal peptide peptidase SppA [Anaerovoracaceae bacterium]
MEPLDNNHVSGQPENPQQPEQQGQPQQPEQQGQPEHAQHTRKARRTIVLKQVEKRGKLPGWAKGLIIFGIIVVCVVLLTVGCNRTVNSVKRSLSFQPDNEVVTDFDYNYIGVLYINGTIDEYGTDTYNHQYLLNAINAMMTDSDNKGMILSVNTPGGSVYASDELYLAIKKYQDVTGRPVYSSMQSQATSGGYYISASCDKIIANRNCWTGSIGVTMGTLMDITELLDNLGIKTTTITSGANKAMGSNYEPMTDEQREIFQSLVDEAYDQFVGIVAEGRDMREKEVRKIADGRIYTAKQALNNGLIDGIGTFEEALQDMQREYDLQGCAVEAFVPKSKTNLYDLLGILSEQKNLSGMTDAQLIEELAELNGTFRLSYIANVKK